jgi:3-oxoacyl-[acyl-carrier-protein] synthase I
MRTQPVAITALTATSCLGTGLEATRATLRAQRSGLMPCDFETARLDTYIGRVPEIGQQPLPREFADYECRNNRLALLGLRQDGFRAAVARAVARYGAQRVGLFLGTSTAGMLEGEIAYRELDPGTGLLPGAFDYQRTLDFFSVVSFARRVLELRGPAAALSTACSSSAKVFGMARRYMNLGLIDAAVVGGVDSLCLTTLYGFHSLQLTSARPCRPFDAQRDGISVGEAAAFALLEADDASGHRHALMLLGVGESSDAHHISSPHPEGAGARRAMQAALDDAGLAAAAVDYINLHGTGTPSNDGAESKAVEAVFGLELPCSSTKGATGHTLGAAGALEIVISAIAIADGFMPAGLHCENLDPACHIRYLQANSERAPRIALSNSLGFGGTNCSVLIGRPA